MGILKKTILIKVTSSLGYQMSSNAESHTLLYFCKWLSKDNNIIVSGIETYSPIIKELEKLDIKVTKPLLKYLFLKKIKYFFHIPVSLFNTFFDCLNFQPELLICLGGVFYNGLGVVITGKILGVKTLVRSAEDHISISKFEKDLFFQNTYAKLRAFLSRIAIMNADYFLTVGEWSINYFRKNYKLEVKNSFMIPGPIDNSIFSKKSFQRTKNQSRKFIKKNYLLRNDYKTILFVGSNAYKGTNNILKLCKKLKKQKILINIIWITHSKRIEESISSLELENYIKVIKPVNREKLVTLIKGADYLFWSTSLGVGYGQIMLESILCNTEILCYKPIGDAKHLVKQKFYSNIDEVINRIKNVIPEKEIRIPKIMNEEILCEKHRKLFNQILEN